MQSLTPHYSMTVRRPLYPIPLDHVVVLTEPGAVFVTADEQYYLKAHRVGLIAQLKEFSLGLQK